jgi:multiple sugar transport system substrate-binding protein
MIVLNLIIYSRGEFYKKILKFLLIFTLSFTIVTCQNNDLPGFGDDKFRIWWQQGFYPEETEAIRLIINKWEQESGKEVELTLYSDEDIVKETENAVNTGKTPDILYNPSIDLTLIPRLAWENKLADVSQIIEPVKDVYTKGALEAVNYFNSKNNKRSYYGIPLQQQTANINYWKYMLKESDLAKNEITKVWNQFWKFWEQEQEKISQTREDFYSIGLPMSPLAGDTFFIFEQFLEAYNVRIVDENGQLLLDNPQVKAGIIEALTEYTNFYKNGYVPPAATQWSNPDNNIAFLSRNLLMTVNPSLSIPGSQREDENTYYQEMGSTIWPNKPNGEEMEYLAGFKQVIVFASAQNKPEVVDFLSYLIKPDNLSEYLKTSQGRYTPVMPVLLEDNFWQNPKDTHIFTAVQQSENSHPFPHVYNPAYTEVLAQNVWGQAMNKILMEGVSVEEAVDQAINQIKQIFADWK